MMPWRVVAAEQHEHDLGAMRRHVLGEGGRPVVEVGPREPGGVLVVERRLEQRAVAREVEEGVAGVADDRVAADVAPAAVRRRWARARWAAPRPRGPPPDRTATGTPSPPSSSLPTTQSPRSRRRLICATLATSCTGCQIVSDRSRPGPSGLRSARSTSASAFTSAAMHKRQRPSSPTPAPPAAPPRPSAGDGEVGVGRSMVSGRSVVHQNRK